jgi:hypothetical protein
MANYRAYFVNSDGHIVGAHVLAGVDDISATREAEKLRDGRDIEIWDGTRMVTRLPAKDSPGTADT